MFMSMYTTKIREIFQNAFVKKPKNVSNLVNVIVRLVQRRLHFAHLVQLPKYLAQAKVRVFALAKFAQDAIELVRHIALAP